MTRHDEIKALKNLARLYRIQTTYQNTAARRRHRASPDALLAVLRALGAPVERVRDARSAVRAREAEIGRRPLDPITVAWNGRARVTLRLPARLEARTLPARLDLEGGESRRLSFNLSDISQSGAVTTGGYVTKKLVLPARLPIGYHRFQLEIEGAPLETLILAAPPTAYEPFVSEDAKAWGIFVPLYALHSRRTLGAGDIRELETIAEWTRKLKGRVVSILPILATFLDTPYDPSPYAPASRLFWNELYLDWERIPGWDLCRPARALRQSPEVRTAVEALRSRTLIDYREIMSIKRRILSELARWFYAHSAASHSGFQQFLKAFPLVEDYAAFRAACERKGAGWKAWPSPAAHGVLREDDYDPQDQRYHIYVQWQMHEQLRSLAEKYRGQGLMFCLDLPLGIHPQSYDVWRNRKLFALGIQGGAPPDAVFTKGQNWGFPPLHPEAIRAHGYRYLIDCFRHQMAHAGMLRLDHVMGLHRLFSIPEGFDAQEGVYVHYRADELYAVLALESWKNHSTVVGENLGMVPAYVNAAMTRRKVKQMYVLEYELAAPSIRKLREPSSSEVASLNTHDMPPFQAFLDGLDIENRLDSNLLNEVTAARERKARARQLKTLIQTLRQRGWLRSASPDARSLLRGSLAFLTASRSPVVLVNLEDLWLETQSQNTPNAKDQPNWRRKLRHERETFSHRAGIVEMLRQVASLRARSQRPRFNPTRDHAQQLRPSAPEANG